MQPQIDDLNYRILANYAERFLRCSLFEYAPGMAILRLPEQGDQPPVRIVDVDADTIDLYVPGADIQTINQSEDPLIDVSDPATFGILLHQFSHGGDKVSDSNPYVVAFDWALESLKLDRLVSAFEYDLPF